MRPTHDREQRQAELLWKYIEELKQVEDPQNVHFVAVTPGESAELVGLMRERVQAHVR